MALVAEAPLIPKSSPHHRVTLNIAVNSNKSRLRLLFLKMDEITGETVIQQKDYIS